MKIARRIAPTLALLAITGLALAQTPPAAPADEAKGATTAPTTQQSAYERLLGDDMDRPERPILPTGRPTIDLTSGNASVAPGAPPVQTRREGSFIVNQVGRLAKAADGQGMEFVFSADGAALQDPPMKVLPNLKLSGMEDTLESMGRDLQFRVTGMVTEYRGRNYILLEKVVVVQDLR